MKCPPSARTAAAAPAMARRISSGIDNSGRPDTTAPILPARCCGAVSAPARCTVTPGNFTRRWVTKSGFISNKVRFCGATPRARMAWVNWPVPGPNSATGPLAGPSPRVMARPSHRDEGASADTSRGFCSSWRRKRNRGEVMEGPRRQGLRKVSRRRIWASCCGGLGSSSPSSSPSSSSSSSSWVSKRRPNSTEGSTKVRTASNGTIRGSG